ncbi:GNAT family N-acetyltransferase [Beggiatoa alba]|nr:GNAT family N-acetyltransferase [Beggiatoa alba]
MNTTSKYVTEQSTRRLSSDHASMFLRQIDTDIKLSLTIVQYADELFSLIDNNRNFLKTWLSWVDEIQKPGDTKNFIQLQLSKLHESEALHQTIFYKGKIAGVLSYNKIDREKGIGYIGYWLGKEYNGKGIMTLAVRDLIKLGFDHLPIQKVDIRCAVENSKSRAIAERLGFKNKGIIRRAEKVDGKYHDHVVYGLLQDELIG